MMALPCSASRLPKAAHVKPITGKYGLWAFKGRGEVLRCPGTLQRTMLPLNALRMPRIASSAFADMCRMWEGVWEGWRGDRGGRGGG
jgi:hypothetical protein